MRLSQSTLVYGLRSLAQWLSAYCRVIFSTSTTVACQKTTITDAVAKSWHYLNTRPVRVWKFPVPDWEFSWPMTSNGLTPIGWVLRRVHIYAIPSPQVHAYAIYETICMLYKVIFTFSCNFECIFCVAELKGFAIFVFSVSTNTILSHFHIVYILSPRQ